MEGQALETTGDVEPTPAQVAEILGEPEPQAPAPGGEPKPGQEGGKPIEPATPPVKVEAPAEPPKIEFSPEQQTHIDKIIGERLDRAKRDDEGTISGLQNRLKTYDDIIQKLTKTEDRAPPGAPAQPPAAPTNPDMVQDVGQFLDDPTYAGWSMAALKEEQPDHYNLCLGRIYQKMDFDKNIKAFNDNLSESTKDQQYDAHIRGRLDMVIKDLGEQKVDYFDEQGRYNEKFDKEFVQWGANQGILDPYLAFRLKGKQHFLSEDELEVKLTEARKEGATGIIKKAKETEPIKKGAGITPVAGDNLADMTDEQVSDIYDEGGPRSQEARKVLVARGLLT